MLVIKIITILLYYQIEVLSDPIINSMEMADSVEVCIGSNKDSTEISPPCHVLSVNTISTDTTLQCIPLSTGTPYSKDTVIGDTLNDSILFRHQVIETLQVPMENIGTLGEKVPEKINLKNDSSYNDTLKLISTCQISDSVSKHTSSVKMDSLAVLDHVVITAKRKQWRSAFATTSVTQYDSLQICRSPGNFGDVNQILSRHPSSSSIATYNDNSLSIRGGHSAENVFIVDGLELDNVSHFMQIGGNRNGTLGILDTRAIRNMTFYTAGTPVDLASRISSVTDIQLSTGNDSSWSHEIDLSVNGAGLMSQGPLLLNGSSYMLLLRYANFKLLDTFLQGTGTPKYGDGLLKISIPVGPCDKLQFLSIGADDKFLESNRKVAKIIRPVDRLDNKGSLTSSIFAAGAAWNHSGKKIRNSLSFTGSNQHKDNSTVFTGNKDTVLMGISLSPYVTISPYSLWSVSGTELVSNTISSTYDIKERFSLAENISIDLNPEWLVSAGVFGKLEKYYIRSQWGMQSFHIVLDQKEMEEFQNYRKLPDHNPIFPAFDRVCSFSNISPGGYLQIAALCEPVSVRTGIRLSRESAFGENGLTAYVGATYKSKHSGNLSLGLNRVEQIPGELNKLIYRSFDYTNRVRLSIRDIELQRCTQTVIEYELKVGKSLECCLAGYGKWYDREFSLRRPEYFKFDLIPDTIDNTIDWMLQTERGKRGVTGTECIVKGNVLERINYEGSASLSVGYDKYCDGEWYRDSNGFFRKALLSIDCRIWRENYLTASFEAQSGKHFSRVEYDNNNSLWAYDTGHVFNSESLDPVYDLSLRYTMHKTIGSVGLNVFIDIYNVLNSTPVIEKTMRWIVLGNEEVRKNGIVPTVGLRLSF